MTRADHPTGTDRLAEAAGRWGSRDDEIVVNVQGDEPLLDPALMRGMAALLAAHPDAAIATACHPIADAAEAFNPNVVKVVLDARGYALYFSRATIPWARDAFARRRAPLPPGLAAVPALRPLRVPRCRSCARFPTLAPAPIERFEALEQLRALWHGYRIVVEITRRDAGAGHRHARGSRARAGALCGQRDHVTYERPFASNDRRYHTPRSRTAAPINRREPARQFMQAQFFQASHDHAIDSARPARRG